LIQKNHSDSASLRAAAEREREQLQESIDSTQEKQTKGLQEYLTRKQQCGELNMKASMLRVVYGTY